MLGSVAPPRCAVPDSAAPRIGRPRRATAVRRSGSRFCNIHPPQGRWTPVTGSGVRPMEAEGAARGRFGLTPAAFLSPRSHHGKAQRSGFAVKRRSKGAQRGIPIYGSPESKRTLRRRVAAGKVTRPAGRNIPILSSRPQAILPRGRRGTIPPVRGKCPEGTKGVGISPRPTKRWKLRLPHTKPSNKLKFIVSAQSNGKKRKKPSDVQTAFDVADLRPACSA